MRYRILGPLAVYDDGRELDLGAGKHRALLALLLLHAGDVVSSDRLVDDLWGERPPPSATKLLQGHVSRLRRVLPADSIVTRDSGYVLREGETDAAEFERLLQSAADEPPRRAAEILRRALALWHGEPLGEFEYESWAQPEIGRLEELRIVALEERIEADLALGRHGALIAELEELVAEHPLRERLRAQLMLALYRSGRQADALEAFTDGRRRLVEELGIEPGPELRQLQRRILEQDPELMAAKPERVMVPVLRRRSLMAAALVGVLAAAVAVPIFSLGGGDSSGSPAEAAVGANAVGAFDPSTGRVVGSTALSGSPRSIALGDGSLWVTMPNRNSVSRINLKTNTVQQTIGAGGGPAGVAVGDGMVWVANSLGGTVWQIDPRTNGGQVVKKIRVGNGPTGIAYGLGGVWVANSVDRTVVRIDPRTGAPGPPIAVDAGADAVAVGDHAVWVTGESAGVLSRIDPRSRRVIEQPINVGNGPVALATAPGAVWVAASRDGTVWRIDPRTNRVRAAITVGEGPSAIAVAPDGRSVWVANLLDGTLSKIDPARDKVVKRVPVGDLPQAIAADSDRAYVAVQGTGAAHRGGTLTVAVPNPPGVYAVKLPHALDPAYGYTAWDLLTLTNDGLVSYGHSGGTGSTRVVPDLAVALPTVTDGGRTYTFQLRPGIRYSTGEPVRPVDIRRGIERALRTVGDELPTSYLSGIVGATACMSRKERCDLRRGIAADNDAGTVTFHLTGADPDFLYKLALPIADALPSETPLHARPPLPATGPYEIAGYDVKRSVIRLRRNPRFRLWSTAAQPDGFPDRIVERYGYTGASAVRAVISGTADITADGPDQTWTPAVASMLRTRYSSRVYRVPIPGTTAVWLNTRLAPFDDLSVRRALQLAIDRRHLIELAGGADVAQVGCQLLPPNIDGYRRYCPYTLHPNAAGTYEGPDLARARALVARSGTKGQPVTVWFYDIPIGHRNGAYVVSVLKRLGYKAHLRTVPHQGSTWRPGRQAGVGGFGLDLPSANDLFSPNFTCRSYDPEHPDANFNVAAFCDRRIDAEIARARNLQATDPHAASRLWSALDRRLTDQALWVVIRNGITPDFVSRRTGNYVYCFLSSLTGSTGACLDQLWVR